MNPVSLQNLLPADLAKAANANLAAHFTWVQRQTPGMHVTEAPDLIWADCGLPCDTFNVVCSARLDTVSAPTRIREAIDYFAYVDRPFSWWLNPGDKPANLGDLLLEAGLKPAESETGMVADIHTLRVGDLSPNGLHVRRVRTASELRHFAHVVAANWNPPDVQVFHFYEQAAPVILQPDSPLWYYVGYVEDVPVASAELTLSGGVVGLYSICTLEAYRRRGYGSALTLQPLLDAREQGWHTAILQSAADSLYARIGFVPFGQITEYKPA